MSTISYRLVVLVRNQLGYLGHHLIGVWEPTMHGFTDVLSVGKKTNIKMSTYDWIRYLGFGEVSSLTHQRTKIVRKTLNVVSNNICKDCFCRWCGMWHSVTKIEMFPEKMRKWGVPGSVGSGFSYWVACVFLECSKSKCLTVCFLCSWCFVAKCFFVFFVVAGIDVLVWSGYLLRLFGTPPGTGSSRQAHTISWDRAPLIADSVEDGDLFQQTRRDSPRGPIEYDGNTWKQLKTHHTYHNSPRISSLARGHSLHFVQRFFIAGDPSTESNPQARPVECKPWLKQGYAPVTLQ